MRVACYQLDIVWEDKPANFRKVQTAVKEARLPSESLLLLPEMFATGFSMNVDAISEGASSPTADFLAGLARESGIFVLGGMAAFGSDGRARNQALAFSPEGELLARYAKIQPFTRGGEAEHYAAGTEIVTFQWQSCTVAPFICYDLRFPELFRAAVQRGAQLFPVIANWPVKRDAHWVTLLQARAIENQAYVAGVNRCGQDPKFNYSGRSLVVDPHGIIVAGIGHREGFVAAEIDLAALEDWRRDFPALRDIHWCGGPTGA